MEPQPIDKNRISDLCYSLRHEFIKCNKGGACAASTIIMCNTKRWHSLLSVFREHTGRQYVLLSALDDSVIVNGRPYYLSTRKYPNVYFPLGHQYLDSAWLNPVPTLTYTVADAEIQKEVLLLSEQNTLLIRYTVLNASEPLTLQLRPLLGLRNSDALIRKDSNINTGNKRIENGILYVPGEREPAVYMQMSRQCEFVTAPDWNYNIEYSDDRMAGQEYQEDLFMPGFFETVMQSGESVIFAVGDHKGQTSQFAALFEQEAQQRRSRESYQDDVEFAAAQLIRERKGSSYIVNSLPESAEFPKQVFMSLPGLTLPSHNTDLFENVVYSLLKQLKNIVFGRYNGRRFSPDSPLWFIWAVQQFFFQKGDIRYTYKQFGKAVNKIIRAGIDNSISGLVTDDSCLLAKSLATEDRYFVETNALWYNALQFAAEMDEFNGEIEGAEIASRTAAKVKLAFNNMFVRSSMLYLPDSVSENGSIDRVCRPAQILAAALPYSVVDSVMADKILISIEQNLLTPRGLLNMPLQSDDEVFVVPEYNDFVAELYLKMRIGDEGMNMANKMYNALNFDGNSSVTPCFYQKYMPTPPYEGVGSPLCAATVAAVSRIKMLIDQY
ncbi:MAG: glycogen debranching enzyme family protein [Bacteroidales bacterium]|nr:glycogen debranching enzyme family protein [Bacteroidales bacterium]